MLEQYVTGRSHVSERQPQVHLVRLTIEPVCPLATPSPQAKAEIVQALHAEQVGRQRDHHMIGGDQSRPIAGTEVRADIDQD